MKTTSVIPRLLTSVRTAYAELNTLIAEGDKLSLQLIALRTARASLGKRRRAEGALADVIRRMAAVHADLRKCVGDAEAAARKELKNATAAILKDEHFAAALASRPAAVRKRVIAAFSARTRRRERAGIRSTRANSSPSSLPV